MNALKNLSVKDKRDLMKNIFFKYKLSILFTERKKIGYFDICEKIDEKEANDHINFKTNIDIILTLLDKDSRDIITKEFINGEQIDCFTFNWSKSVFYRRRLEAINQFLKFYKM